MSQYSPIEQYEYDFVSETYCADWPVSVIAEKLERPESTIDNIVKFLGLKRPNHNVRTPSHDWPSIWYAYCPCGSCVADALGISRQVVAYAVQKMILMGAEERLIRWNKYAIKHGREEYTGDDLNVIV